MLGAALVVIFAALAWTLGHMLPFFYAFLFLKQLRISKDEEEQGLDRLLHGGWAYDHEEGIDEDTRDTVVNLCKQCAFPLLPSSTCSSLLRLNFALTL
jgi:hypothetical protein